MFGKRVTLFKLLGFAVRVDASWLIIAVLITWSLAAGVFPERYQNLSPVSYWIMGIAGALGLFASIVLHELSHSLVARRYGLPMKGITLFIFGGVAEMTDEPARPKVEFLMAIAGPVASVLIAAVSYGIFLAATAHDWPTAVRGVFGYLGWINGLLVAFNLVPAFPLDGGRVLRSALWAWRGNLRWATRVASAIGSGFGVVLIVLGIVSVVRGNLVGGLWWFLIGMFVRNASQSSYQHLLVRQALGGEPVRRFMRADPVSVPSSIPVADLVENYIYQHHYKMYPVLDNGQLIGCVSVRQVKGVPRAEWSRRTVGDLAEPCSEENTVPPGADALQALATMTKTHASRLMVVEDGHLVGVLALKDLLKFFSLKMELEDL